MRGFGGSPRWCIQSSPLFVPANCIRSSPTHCHLPKWREIIFSHHYFPPTTITAVLWPAVAWSIRCPSLAEKQWRTTCDPIASSSFFGQRHHYYLLVTASIASSLLFGQGHRLATVSSTASASVFVHRIRIRLRPWHPSSSIAPVFGHRIRHVLGCIHRGHHWIIKVIC